MELPRRHGISQLASYLLAHSLTHSSGVLAAIIATSVYYFEVRTPVLVSHAALGEEHTHTHLERPKFKNAWL